MLSPQQDCFRGNLMRLASGASDGDSPARALGRRCVRSTAGWPPKPDVVGCHSCSQYLQGQTMTACPGRGVCEDSSSLFTLNLAGQTCEELTIARSWDLSARRGQLAQTCCSCTQTQTAHQVGSEQSSKTFSRQSGCHYLGFCTSAAPRASIRQLHGRASL